MGNKKNKPTNTTKTQTKQHLPPPTQSFLKEKLLTIFAFLEQNGIDVINRTGEHKGSQAFVLWVHAAIEYSTEGQEGINRLILVYCIFEKQYPTPLYLPPSQIISSWQHAQHWNQGAHSHVSAWKQKGINPFRSSLQLQVPLETSPNRVQGLLLFKLIQLRAIPAGIKEYILSCYKLRWHYFSCGADPLGDSLQDCTCAHYRAGNHHDFHVHLHTAVMHSGSAEAGRYKLHRSQQTRPWFREGLYLLFTADVSGGSSPSDGRDWVPWCLTG